MNHCGYCKHEDSCPYSDWKQNCENYVRKKKKEGSGMKNKTYFAVVAVDNIYSNGHIMDWAENVPENIKELEAENNWLSETEFIAVECGLYIARLMIDDTEAEWDLMLDDDHSVSGYEIIGFLNQFVADLEHDMIDRRQ